MNKSDFSHEVLFVLGAGASKPYGYPTGYELRNKIFHDCSNLQGTTTSILRQIGYSDDQIKHFGKEFRASLQYSIDSFLKERSDLMGIGKDAIAINILEAEKNITTHYPVKHNWISYIINNYIGNSKSSYNNVKLNFITFNYDRSLEYILFNSIKSSLIMDNDSAKGIFQRFYIHHVYGKVGNILGVNDEKNVVPFGSFNEPIENIKVGSQGIKVMHEERIETIEPPVQDYFYSSRQIFFLGFGFDELNIKRLGIDWKNVNGKVFATGLGMMDLEIDRIISRLDIDKGKIRINNLDNEHLLRLYLRKI